jgi:hypothetical protein
LHGFGCGETAGVEQLRATERFLQQPPGPAATIRSSSGVMSPLRSLDGLPMLVRRQAPAHARVQSGHRDIEQHQCRFSAPAPGIEGIVRGCRRDALTPRAKQCHEHAKVLPVVVDDQYPYTGCAATSGKVITIRRAKSITASRAASMTAGCSTRFDQAFLRPLPTVTGDTVSSLPLGRRQDRFGHQRDHGRLFTGTSANCTTVTRFSHPVPNPAGNALLPHHELLTSGHGHRIGVDEFDVTRHFVSRNLSSQNAFTSAR